MKAGCPAGAGYECQSKDDITEMKTMIRELYDATFKGNGKPSMMTRLALLESRGWWFPGAVATVGVLFGAVAAYAAVKGMK